jgi:hypothetical protein
VLDMSAVSVTALIENYHHALGGTKAALLGAQGVMPATP